MSTTRRNTAAKRNSVQLSRQKISLGSQKVFLFKEQLINDSNELEVHRLYHPGRETGAYFIISSVRQEIYEILEFNQPHRSWLINENVCSNGRNYLTVPVDPTFLILYYIHKFCSNKAIQLHQIEDEKYPILQNLLEIFGNKKTLESIADMKTSLEIVVYKYNHNKTLAWLAIKTKRLAERLKKEAIYCGFSSLSANYAKSEKTQEVDDDDYNKVACGIIGNYLDLKLYNELLVYLSINDDEPVKKSNVPVNKRKSAKMDITSPDLGEDDHTLKKIKLETSYTSPPTTQQSGNQKEKKVNAKEKALAKAATGMKSISSFFKK